MVSARQAIAVAALSLFGCAKVWGFDDLSAGNRGTGGSGSVDGVTGGSSNPGSIAGMTGTGGAVRACQLSCQDPCESCVSGCTDLLSDPVNCGACGTSCQGGRICANGKCECPSGFTLCNDVSPPGCFDLSNDVAHCGECATACRNDGLCIEGSCEYPEDLVTGLSTPAKIAVDDEYVYYSVIEELRRVPLAGGEPEMLAAPGATSEIVLAGDSLYYTSNQAIMRLLRGGGDPTLLAEVVPPAPLAVYDDNVYFLEGNALGKVSIDGEDRRSLVDSAGLSAAGIVVNADGVYTARLADFLRWDFAGGSYTSVAQRGSSTQTQPLDFVVANGKVYYCSGISLESIDLGAVVSNPRISSHHCASLVVDGGEIVFLSSYGIEAVSTTPGSTPRLLSADSRGVDLAVTSEHVYWTRYESSAGRGDGMVRRAPR